MGGDVDLIGVHAVAGAKLRRLGAVVQDEAPGERKRQPAHDPFAQRVFAAVRLRVVNGQQDRFLADEGERPDDAPGGAFHVHHVGLQRKDVAGGLQAHPPTGRVEAGGAAVGYQLEAGDRLPASAQAGGESRQYGSGRDDAGSHGLRGHVEQAGLPGIGMHFQQHVQLAQAADLFDKRQRHVHQRR